MHTRMRAHTLTHDTLVSISEKIEWVSSCNNSIASNWVALKFSDFLEQHKQQQ